jgi:hypothetical protein
VTPKPDRGHAYEGASDDSRPSEGGVPHGDVRSDVAVQREGGEGSFSPPEVAPTAVPPFASTSSSQQSEANITGTQVGRRMDASNAAFNEDVQHDKPLSDGSRGATGIYGGSAPRKEKEKEDDQDHGRSNKEMTEVCHQNCYLLE